MSKNHEITSYAEFQAAVIKALPRDIDQDTMRRWTHEKKLAHILRETLTPSKIIKELSITCDGDKDFSTLIDLGGYRWEKGSQRDPYWNRYQYCSSEYRKYNWFRTDEYFPIKKHKPIKRTVVLIEFRNSPTLKEVRSEFMRRHLEHPTFEDIGYFGIQHIKIAEKASHIIFIPKAFDTHGMHGVAITLANINAGYVGGVDRYKHIVLCGENINGTLGASLFAAIRE